MSTYASQCVADYFMRTQVTRKEMAEAKRNAIATSMALMYAQCGPDAEYFFESIATTANNFAEQCRERVKEMND